MAKTGLLCLALASALALPFEVEAQQQVKLRATIQVAITERLWGVALGRFKEEIEKRSEKKLSLEVFDKGKLYVDDAVVDAIASGAIEMGVAGLYQLAKKVPAIDMMEQPFLFNFDALVRAVVNPDSEVRKIIDTAVLDKLGNSCPLVAIARQSNHRIQGPQRNGARPDQGAADTCFR